MSADGLLVNQSSVNASKVVARHNARTGVFYNDSGGEVRESLLTQNLMGLVNQGNPSASISDDTQVVDNDQDLLIQGQFEVADEPLVLPDLPDYE